MLSIKQLISQEECYKAIRELRWPEGVECIECGSKNVKRNGHVPEKKACQRGQCKECSRYFDDLTGTVFSSRRQPVEAWALCMYFMGLNLSSRQIAQELDLNISDVHEMS